MNLETAMAIWTPWRATKGRFLPNPGALLDQDPTVMNMLFTLDGLMERVSQQYIEKKNHGRENS